MREVLLKLAEEVKAAALALVTSDREYLTLKIEQEKAEAQFKINLKLADPKVTQVSMDNQADVQFEADRKILLDKKLAAKQVEIDYEYAANKLEIEEIVAQLPK
jgi:hypothetical protein